MATVGRWPWRSASAKKRVITYLPNRGAPKMDGADLRREAPGALRGRRARACRRRACAGAAGGARGADLGSSSTSTSMQRRVRPRKEVMRRLRKGDCAAIRSTARWVATRARRQRRTGGNFPAGPRERDAASEVCCTVKRTRAGRTEPHQGSGVHSPACRARPVREVGKIDE